MFGAEVTRGVYPPGTLYPGQQRSTMRLGGQTVLIAPPHPHEGTATAPPFPRYGLEHDLQLTATSRASMQRQELNVRGARGDEKELAELPIPGKYRWVPEGV